MIISERFKQLVKTYARMEIEFPHLKAVTVAQWLLESGRGTSELCARYNNFAGLKFRDELSAFATAITYGAHDGVDQYCSFPSIENFIKGYWRFIDRNPYAGWREHVSNGREYISWLKSCGYATDPGYVEKVIGLVPEATALLLSEENGQTSGDVTWFENNLNDRSETVVVAYAGEKPVAICTSDDIVIQRRFEDQYPKAKTKKTAPAGKAVPGVPEYNRGEVPPPPAPKPSTGKRVMLDPGHSERHVGARSRNGRIEEENLNRLQAERIKARLEAAGHRAEIYDPADDSLSSIGARAAGFDAFISLHHNAFDGSGDPGCEVLIDNDKGKASSLALAADVSARIANALGIRNRGAKRQGLGVLDAAERGCSGPCILTESFFVTNYTDVAAAEAKSLKAADAIADGILAFLAR